VVGFVLDLPLSPSPWGSLGGATVCARLRVTPWNL
jgi:hypothetical protein